MRRKRITLKTVSENVLKKMRAEVGSLVEDYVWANIESSSFGLLNLRQKLYETGGSGCLLLSAAQPLRVKLLTNGQYGKVSFIAPIFGAEDFLVIYDCCSQGLRIEAASNVAMQLFN